MKSEIGVRFAVVALLTLLANIPLLFVSHLVDERQRYHAEAIDHVARAWGGRQTITGPFLLVPELRQVATEKSDGELVEQRRARVILPNQLNIDSQVQHEQRHRSIYTVPVYRSQLSLKGDFLPPATGGRLLWQEAKVVLGISSPHAIVQLSELRLGDQRYSLGSGTGEDWLMQGVHALVTLDQPQSTLSFDVNLLLKGTQSLKVAPTGANTEIDMTASWPHPGFGGDFLPDTYQVDANGFEAKWQLGQHARNLPSDWLIQPDVAPVFPFVQVDLFQPTTPYVLIDRGLKYAMLFISLTFLCLLAFELRMGLRVHYVQYGVVALGLVLFYVTLLSLSEHIGFTAAYVLAVLLLTGLVGWYAWRLSRRQLGRTVGIAVAVLLLLLYLCLYVLLLLQAYALLVGTAVLLLSLAALMHITAELEQPAQET